MKTFYFIMGCILLLIEFSAHYFIQQPILLMPYYIVALVVLYAIEDVWYLAIMPILYDLFSGFHFGIISLVSIIGIGLLLVSQRFFGNGNGRFIIYGITSGIISMLSIALQHQSGFSSVIVQGAVSIIQIVVVGTVVFSFTYFNAQRIQNFPTRR